MAQIVKQKNIEIHPPLLLLGNGQPLEDSIIADTFESLIGAIYFDVNQGLAKIQKIVQTSLADDILSFEPGNDFISRLQSYVQKKLRKDKLETTDLVYVQVSHEPELQNRHSYVYAVEILEEQWGEGTGFNSKIAKQAAAAAALSRIELGITPFD